MFISVIFRNLFKYFQGLILSLICFVSLAAQADSTRLKEAEVLAKQEKWVEVVNLLKPEAVSLDRKGKLLLISAYEKTDNLSGQIQVLNTIIAENQKDFEAHTLLGEALLKSSGKSKDEAAASFRSALENKKNYVRAYQGLIKVYEETKNSYELLILYQDMIRILGEKSEYVSALCRLNAQEAYLDAAKKWCNMGLELDPKNGDNHVYLGIVLRDSGNETQGLKILKKAADQFAKSDLAQVKYADILSEKKDHLGASKYYQRAVDANKKSLSGWDGLAHSSLEISKYDIAVKAFEEACKIDRKILPKVRKALAIVRSRNEKNWTRSFENVADDCGLSK